MSHFTLKWLVSSVFLLSTVYGHSMSVLSLDAFFDEEKDVIFFQETVRKCDLETKKVDTLTSLKFLHHAEPIDDSERVDKGVFVIITQDFTKLSEAHCEKFFSSLKKYCLGRAITIRVLLVEYKELFMVSWKIFTSFVQGILGLPFHENAKISLANNGLREYHKKICKKFLEKKDEKGSGDIKFLFTEEEKRQEVLYVL